MGSFSWSKINKPVYVLAPMANITTLPFRSICREMGADIVFTPMISSNAIVYNPDKTLEIGKFLGQERPVIVQLFGYSGELMAKAAKIIERELKPDGIDINMGCPAPKITGNECGSALLKNFSNALEIVRQVRKEFKGQLSVKLRLGWQDFDIIDFVKELENIGVDAISVHGRTTKQGYTGVADWDKIYQIADSVNIPVIGNGDITNRQQALDKLEDSKLAGVMIGRGSLGNPWIFKEIKLKSEIKITKKELAETILKQANLSVDFYGEKQGIMEMRKHLGWYIKGFPGALEIRKRAMLSETIEDIEKIAESIKNLEI